MAETKTILIYQISIETARSEEDIQTMTRMALASLFHTTARALESGIDRGSLFGIKDKITLSLETDKWDRNFVLKIERVDNE